MIKDLKSAISFGVLIWIIIFVVVTITIFTPGLKDWTMVRWLLNWAVDIVAAYYFARKYYVKNSGTVRDGLILGWFWLAIGAVLDFAVTIPLFIKQQAGQVYNMKVSYASAAAYFFKDWQLWIGLLIIIITPAIAFYLMQRAINKPPKQPRFQPPQNNL